MTVWTAGTLSIPSIEPEIVEMVPWAASCMAASRLMVKRVRDLGKGILVFRSGNWLDRSIAVGSCR